MPPRLRPSGARRAVVASCLVSSLLACARFGFEPLRGDEERLDAGLGPVSSLDGSVGWPGGAAGSSDTDAGSPSRGGSGGGGSGGAADGGTGGAGGNGGSSAGGEAGSEGDAGVDDAGGAGAAGNGGAGAGGNGGAGAGGNGGAAGNGGSSGSGSVGGCTQFGAFGAPERVGGLPASLGIGPALSDDALTLLFVSGNPYDVFAATRSNITSHTFGNVVALGAVNSSGTEATPFLTDGGLTLLLASDRPSNDGFNDLMIATRASTSDVFGTPTAIANVNSNGVELAPQLSTDGLRLYFSSDRSNNDRDIYMASRASRSDNFSAPTRVSVSSAQSQEFGPSLRGDELEVFIASDRGGGSGSMDIWRAVRASVADPFDQPVNLAVVNSSGYETDPRLSPDGTELFFASSQGAPQSSLVLWVATRSCLDPP